MNDENKEEDVIKDDYSLLKCREKFLGYKSYCNNPESYQFYRIIRSSIKDIYFFGQEITEEEIDSFEWK